MEFKNFDEVINFAIAREREAIHVYGEMSENAAVPGIKELLLELQAEEKKHEKMLLELAPEKVAGFKIKPVMDLKISDYLVEENLDTEMNFQDLLIYAAKKEQKAAELYAELAARSDTPEMKKMFEFMVQQEKSHKLKLEKEYDDHILEED